MRGSIVLIILVGLGTSKELTTILFAGAPWGSMYILGRVYCKDLIAKDKNCCIGSGQSHGL